MESGSEEKLKNNRGDLRWQNNALAPQAMKILIVDDIPENISALALALESEGFTLAMASCGEEALQITENYLPDCVPGSAKVLTYLFNSLTQRLGVDLGANGTGNCRAQGISPVTE